MATISASYTIMEYDGGSSGTSSGFDLTADPTVFRLTSRGITKAGQTIRAVCSKQGTTAAVTWECSQEYTYETEGDDSVILIAIPEGQSISSITIACSIASLGLTKSLTVTGVPEGEADIMYLGVFYSVDSFPKPLAEGGVMPTSEGDLILGDCLVYEDTSAGTRDPYYWTGDDWAIADGGMPASIAYKVLTAVMYDQTKAPATENTVNAVNIFAQNMGINRAFVDSFMGNFLKVLGAIYGGAYQEDGSNPTGGAGFWMGENGVLRAVAAYLLEATVTGMFTCEDSTGIIMKTQQASSVKTVSCSSPQRWITDDAIDSVSIGATGTATFNGSSYSFKRCSESSSFKLKRIDGSGWFGSLDTTFTSTVTGDIQVKVYSIFDLDSGYCSVYVNGSKVLTNSSLSEKEWHNMGTISVKKGDSIRITSKQTGMADGPNFELYFIDSDALLLYTSTGDDAMSSCQTLCRGEVYSYTLTLSTGFRSSSNIKYAYATGWANGLSSYNVQYPMQSGTSVTINGISVSLAYAIKTTSTLSLYSTTGAVYTFSLSYSSTQGSSTGWYWISGSLKIATAERGLITDTLIPAQTAANVGTASKPYNYGYFKTLNATSASLSSLSLGSSRLGTSGYTYLPNGMMIQWGAVTPTGSGYKTFTVTTLQFSSAPYWAWNTVEFDDTTGAYFTGFINDKGYMTASRIKFAGYGGVINRWIAIGKA